MSKTATFVRQWEVPGFFTDKSISKSLYQTNDEHGYIVVSRVVSSDALHAGELSTALFYADEGGNEDYFGEDPLDTESGVVFGALTDEDVLAQAGYEVVAQDVA